MSLPRFKIVELKDGFGSLKYKIKAKVGWGFFGFWEQRGCTMDTMKEAQEGVEDRLREYKSEIRIKVKEYMYHEVPNHVPEKQVGKFMELKENK